MSVENWNHLGLAFGLFMAGVSSNPQINTQALSFVFQFSGHAVIPSLARDMVDPSQFDRMINWAFVGLMDIFSTVWLTQYQVAATFLYALIGYAGYLMFGNYVSDEVSPF